MEKIKLEDIRTQEKEIKFTMGIEEIIREFYQDLLISYKNTDKKTERSILEFLIQLSLMIYLAYSETFNQTNISLYLRDIFSKKRLNTKSLKAIFHSLRKKDLNLKPLSLTENDLFIPEISEIAEANLKELVDFKTSWDQLSPTLFGMIFESSLNPETKQENGAHYTSVENIHKVIDPLFLKDLVNELNTIEENYSGKILKEKLKSYSKKLSQIIILDPACGTGNFLVESFLSLSRLNRRVEQIAKEHELHLSPDDLSRVLPDQFYGIEIDPLAAEITKLAFILAQIKLNQEDSDFLYDQTIVKTPETITVGNALRLNWEEIVDKNQLSYIIGNPPYLGARTMQRSQKEDILSIFGQDYKRVGDLDYISGWFKKAADMIRSTDIRAAFISTSSINQGSHIANLWKELLSDSLYIDFAYEPFLWNHDSQIHAYVYCTIIGLSGKKPKICTLFNKREEKKVSHINAYLTEGKDRYIESRPSAICREAPVMEIGNKPIDDGNYLFKKEEMEAFLEKEPGAKPYFRKFYGSREFLKSDPRYCLFLSHVDDKDLEDLPLIRERIEKVREFRLNSKSRVTQELAKRPKKFHIENVAQKPYIVIPRVTTDKREYSPIGYLEPGSIASDSVHMIKDVELYHFAILQSKLHSIWVQAVCGRLGDGLRYSKNVVYNNFPWPKLDEEIKKKLNRSAKKILEIRKKYDHLPLKDLYDPKKMPDELLQAHKENDALTLEAYGFSKDLTEKEYLNLLFDLYEKIIN